MIDDTMIDSNLIIYRKALELACKEICDIENRRSVKQITIIECVDYFYNKAWEILHEK